MVRPRAGQRLEALDDQGTAEASDDRPRTLARAPTRYRLDDLSCAANLLAMPAQVTVAELKAMIVEKLNLKGVAATDIGDDAPLFGAGLGLDSVDALELVLAVESEYGVQIEDDQIGKEAFASPRALCDFVNARLQVS